MPLSNGAPQAPRKEQKYTDAQIEQLAAYVQSLGGGPTPPSGRLDDGDLALGGDLFRTNCASCHNFAGKGGALTRSKYAPPLTEADALEIYTAMQSGPENMPRFTDNQLTPDEKRAIVHYVRYVTEAKNPGGAGLGGYGPVPEGLAVFLVGMGLLILVTLWIGARA
jgi:ubiquinol-cytochrome c reductase cytochrome c subunit